MFRRCPVNVMMNWGSMTFEEVEREFSFGSWLFQLVVTYPVPVVLLGILENRLSAPDTFIIQVLGYAFVALMGITLAFLVSKVSRESAKEGSWIWLVPTALVIAAVLWQLCSGGIASTFHGFLFGHGEESWGMVILTIPTFGCCCYSAAMWWQLRTNKTKANC